MAVAAEVLSRAGAAPDRPAVRCEGSSAVLSYAALAARVRRAAATLQRRGCRPGSRVALHLTDPLDLLTTLLGSDLLGSTAVVLSPDWPAGQRDAALAATRPDLVVGGPGGDLDADSLLSGPAPAADPAPQDPRAVVWLGFTSGSTGSPRPVARTRRSWTASFPAFGTLSGIGPHDDVLLPGPLTSSLFLFGALHALAVGASVRPLPAWSPEAAARAARGSTAVHLVPSMLAALLDRDDPDALGSLRRVVCAGAHLDDALRGRAEARGLAVLDYYGAAELSFVGYRRSSGPMRPFPGVAVEVRDPDGRPAHGRLGEVWSHSPYQARGYADGATGPLRRDARGFATVGDLGVCDPAGLTVRGRGADAVVTGGATVLAEDVESALREVPGVRDVTVVGLPHARLGQVVAAVVEPWPGRPPASATLRAAARERLAPAQRPRVWWLTESLPRLASGKPARAAVAAALAAGTLPVRGLG